MNKKTKAIAGYQILLMLSNADGEIDPREGSMIAEYIGGKFPLGSNLDDALDEMIMTNPDDYPAFLYDLAADFYADSSDDERKDFIKFALELVKVDEHLAREENTLISKLFEAWDL